MRASILAALLAAVFALPATAAPHPVKGVVNGTAAAGKGIARGTVTAARSVGHGAVCVLTLGTRC